MRRILFVLVLSAGSALAADGGALRSIAADVRLVEGLAAAAARAGNTETVACVDSAHRPLRMLAGVAASIDEERVRYLVAGQRRRRSSMRASSA